jgi:hypothetical protein
MQRLKLLLVAGVFAVGGCAATGGEQAASVPARLTGQTTPGLVPAEFRQAEVFAIDGAGPLPLDKRYAELSDRDRSIYRSWYHGLGDKDVPPFPENGFSNLYEEVVGSSYRNFGGSRRAGIRARYYVLVHVDDHGTAHSIEVARVALTGARVLNYDIPENERYFLGKVFMGEKYQPGLCDGEPCPMDLAVLVNLVPNPPL